MKECSKKNEKNNEMFICSRRSFEENFSSFIN